LAWYLQVKAAECLALVAGQQVLGDHVSAALRGLPAKIEHVAMMADQGSC